MSTDLIHYSILRPETFKVNKLEVFKTKTVDLKRFA